MGKCKLVLEDGTIFIGEAFGSELEMSGEVVFNTAMSGYQEIISDPAYYGQIVTLTYPSVGSYGINRDDFEAVAPAINGIVVKEVCDDPSNFRSDETLSSLLKAYNIPGIAGIDTRKLTKHIRNQGTMKGMITNIDQSSESIVEQLKSSQEINNPVNYTSTVKPYVVPGRGKRVVLVDFGVKHGIMRELTKRNCHITVVPYDYNAEQIMRLKADGILLSNGPGNPKDVEVAIEMIQQLIATTPMFGIGLGHQLMALAMGANTEKMLFGHRGNNHAVKDIKLQKTILTMQNHSYTVEKESLAKTDLQVTHVALNDNTIEGIRHKVHPAFSVQFYPESSPGPEEGSYLFDEFLTTISTFQAKEVRTHANQ